MVENVYWGLWDVMLLWAGNDGCVALEACQLLLAVDPKDCVLGERKPHSVADAELIFVHR